jgi:hypothetical protein
LLVAQRKIIILFSLENISPIFALDVVEKREEKVNFMRTQSKATSGRQW